LKKKIMKIKMLAVVLVILAGSIMVSAQNGFDQYGYNYQARIFVGAADGVDKSLDNAVWGDPTYANDHLVMKWSKAWDDAKYHGAAWTSDAWIDNEWNGMMPNGSGETWHYKIVHVDINCGADGAETPDGGLCIWGDFEVFFSHGTMANEHFWEAHVRPAGQGGF
jgi:hypothetical protein